MVQQIELYMQSIKLLSFYLWLKKKKKRFLNEKQKYP